MVLQWHRVTLGVVPGRDPPLIGCGPEMRELAAWLPDLAAWQVAVLRRQAIARYLK